MQSAQSKRAAVDNLVAYNKYLPLTLHLSDFYSRRGSASTANYYARLPSTQKHFDWAHTHIHMCGIRLHMRTCTIERDQLIITQ